MADRHTYILHLSPPLRELLAKDAADTDRSMNEIIRQTLCEHYAMDCPEIRRGRRDFSSASLAVPVRVSEELFTEVFVDAQQTKRSIRQVILDVLESHYELKV